MLRFIDKENVDKLHFSQWYLKTVQSVKKIKEKCSRNVRKFKVKKMTNDLTWNIQKKCLFSKN